LLLGRVRIEEPLAGTNLTDTGPLILFRTPYFGGPVPLEGVPAGLRGHFTADAARIAEADAVVFHVPDWRPSQLQDAPKYPGQLWVLWSMESAINYPRMADPAFLRHFDLMVTYQRTADIWSSYLPDHARWEAALSMPQPGKTEAAPLVMFQTAIIDGCGRNAFSRALMRQIPVDSYGRVHRNRTLGADKGRQSKLETIARYRFCLSLENSIGADYVTEKLFDPLMVGTVPVYRGAPNAVEFAPEHSYIDAEAYGGPKGLAEYLRHLMNSPDEYEAYFAWRKRPLPVWMREKLEATATPYWIRLLQRVAEARGNRKRGWPRFPFGLRAALSARGTRLVRQLAGKPATKVQFQ
jgi:alpha-1,3-fucosyltransferase 10